MGHIGMRWLRASSALISLLSVGLLSQVCLAADNSWIQGEWISDSEASVAANPAFESLEAAQKAAAESMFGRMRWKISGDVLTTSYTESDTGAADTHSTAFAIEQGVGEELRILIVEDEAQTRLQLQQTDTGFCLQVFVWSVHDPQWSEGTVVECFRRVNS